MTDDKDNHVPIFVEHLGELLSQLDSTILTDNERAEILVEAYEKQMIKTQHCPNCEATEQKLHDFRQEVSDAVFDYFQNEGDAACKRLCGFITPTAKPDPLVEVLKALPVGRASLETYSRNFRAALEARGLEIREKNDDR